MDNNGTVSYSYNDVGLRTNMTVTGQNTMFYRYDNANWLTNVTRTKFTAREDDGTGLYYYRARYYNPMLARFVSEDLVEYYAIPNLYDYVDDNPENETDSSGLTNDPGDFGWDVYNPPRPGDGTTSTITEFGNILIDPDGYTACYAHCVVFGTTAKAASELGGAAFVAKRWYSWKYPNWFRAGGRYSKVLVPRFAARASFAFAVLGLYDAYHCYKECKCKLR